SSGGWAAAAGASARARREGKRRRVMGEKTAGLVGEKARRPGGRRGWWASRQRPRLALRAVEPAGGLGVADDLLPGRVPFERPLQPVGDVAEVADGAGPVGDLDVAEAPLARLDAVDEVAEDAAPALVGRHVGGARRLRRPRLAPVELALG